MNKEEMLKNYQQLWDTCIIRTERINEIDSILSKIVGNKVRYESVERETNVPWWFVGIIHCMESNCNFKTHLHNGDPLTARTVHVPKDRPITGNPPFSWEESAIDALKYKKYDGKIFDIPNSLYMFEAYNGMGYSKMGLNSPYLWSYSNHYDKGKFVADGKFDKDAVSKQCGAAVILKRMIDSKIVQFPCEEQHDESCVQKFFIFMKKKVNEILNYDNMKS